MGNAGLFGFLTTVLCICISVILHHYNYNYYNVIHHDIMNFRIIDGKKTIPFVVRSKNSFPVFVFSTYFREIKKPIL